MEAKIFNKQKNKAMPYGTELCGVCKEEQPKWKVHNEVKGVKFCRDCVANFRALAKANKRDYFKEVDYQIDYVLNAT